MFYALSLLSDGWTSI